MVNEIVVSAAPIIVHGPAIEEERKSAIQTDGGQKFAERNTIFTAEYVLNPFVSGPELAVKVSVFIEIE